MSDSVQVTDNEICRPTINIEMLQGTGRWATFIEDVQSLEKARSIVKVRKEIYQQVLRIVLVVKSVFPEEGDQI